MKPSQSTDMIEELAVELHNRRQQRIYNPHDPFDYMVEWSEYTESEKQPYRDVAKDCFEIFEDSIQRIFIEGKSINDPK